MFSTPMFQKRRPPQPFIYLAITYLWVFISLPVCFLAIPFGQLIIRPDKKMYGKMFPDVVTIEEEPMTAEGKEPTDGAASLMELLVDLCGAQLLVE